jgi:hypothetical protein
MAVFWCDKFTLQDYFALYLKKLVRFYQERQQSHAALLPRLHPICVNSLENAQYRSTPFKLIKLIITDFL